MIVRLPATLRPGVGHRPGPRVRPVPDRWHVSALAVAEARADGAVVLVDVGGPDGAPWVLVSADLVDGDVRLERAYVDAVLAAGGRPLLVPPGETQVAALLDVAAALVLAGGAFDIHPRHYGQPVTARLDRVVEDRTELELALARGALVRGLPVLGVCGGMQALAVAAGGTLVQDLPVGDHLVVPTHEQRSDPGLGWHDIDVEPPLAAWIGPTLTVNSTHHQAVDAPGAWHVVARARDGTVEAIHHPEHPFAVGVQWHPERMGDFRLYRALLLTASARARAADAPAPART